MAVRISGVSYHVRCSDAVESVEEHVSGCGHTPHMAIGAIRKPIAEPTPAIPGARITVSMPELLGEARPHAVGRRRQRPINL